MSNYLPVNVSTFGGDIDHVMIVIFWVVGVWFIAAEALLLFFILTYRRREGVRAAWMPANTLRAMAWVLMPVALVFICDLVLEGVSAPVWSRVKEQIPPGDVVVHITGSQFQWRFTYAGRDGKFDTDDDIDSIGDMYVPVHKVVRFQLEAMDVLHSLWIPNLRLKQDAVPGRSIPGWFEATQVGTYPIGCAQLCGMGHGMMKAKLHVLAVQDFDKWLARQEKKS